MAYPPNAVVTIMALKKIDKNQMVTAFLQFIADGNRTYAAASKAGFSAPRRDIARQMHSPELGQRVTEAVQHRVRTVLLPEAMAITEEMLKSKTVSDRIRWDIAKTLLTNGAISNKQLEKPPQDIGAMTADDIMKLRQTLEAEMNNRANNAKLIDAQSLDYLD
jgi:hypothetical protein